MKKTVKLTEKDLSRIVKRIINEDFYDFEDRRRKPKPLDSDSIMNMSDEEIEDKYTRFESYSLSKELNDSMLNMANANMHEFEPINKIIKEYQKILDIYKQKVRDNTASRAPMSKYFDK